jgi:hypothetical protein
VRRSFVRLALSLGALVVGLFALPGAARAAEPCGKQRFVTIYDSHGLTMFGDRLDRLLLGSPGAELTSYTLGGASPEWLVTTKVSLRGYFYASCDKIPLVPRAKLDQRKLRAPSLDDLFRAPPGTYDKQVVLITLGSNMPGDPALQAPNVEKIVRRIRAHSNATCVWIGPPSMRKWSTSFGNKVYAALEKGIRAATDDASSNAPACHLIDSRKISSYPAGGDGWHYGFFPAGIEAAKKWADAVGSEVQKILDPTASRALVAQVAHSPGKP